MNEYLPYEESLKHKLADLPLPNEDMAWQKMKKLLEEDDDDRGFIIPPITKGCAGWILLVGLLLTGLIWYFSTDQQWFSGNNNNETTIEKTESKGNESITGNEENKPGESTNSTVSMDVPDGNSESKSSTESSSNTRSESNNPNNLNSSSTAHSATNSTSDQLISNSSPNNKSIGGSKKKSRVVVATGNRSSQKKGTSKSTANIKQTNGNNSKTTSNVENSPNKTDEIGVLTQEGVVTPEPGTQHVNAQPEMQNDGAVPPADSIKNADSVAKPAAKPPEPPKRAKFTFGAGLGLQQQLPLAGQKPVPYNAYGREGSLADYIPSVYFRMYREKKWFIQGEFRYGAPQYAKEFTYGSNSVVDTSGGITVTTTTSMSLKKSYYHQIPVSFNYNVRPNWSVGSGFMYSKFFSAISEEDITRRTPTDTVITKQILQVDSDTDTAFTKSQFNILFESQYTWKRFTFGLRYVRGLQPYIRFTDPNGVAREEKNQSFQLILKYELWKSNKE